MAAKAASECSAHAPPRDQSLYEPWEMTPRERDVANKYVKLLQGTYVVITVYSSCQLN